ncbi:MAG: hypothetical protein KDD35_03770, partial [Bdellovibrionales bacterium]|nr:hypothetical protein [Bdellovibrionales bacterium]
MKPITSAQFVDQVSSKLPLLLLVHILSACSPSFSQNHTQIRRIAPHAPSDVGTLIEGVQEKEIRKLLD